MSRYGGYPKRRHCRHVHYWLMGNVRLIVVSAHSGRFSWIYTQTKKGIEMRTLIFKILLFLGCGFGKPIVKIVVKHITPELRIELIEFVQKFEKDAKATPRWWDDVIAWALRIMLGVPSQLIDPAKRGGVA